MIKLVRLIETRTKLLEIIPKNSVIAEVGVFDGKFSEEILHVCKPNKLFLIDKWSGPCHSGDKDGKNIVRYKNMEVVFENIKKRMTSPNVFFKRGDSNYVLDKFNNNFFDCIYIDADHNYTYVKKDLEISRKKVKKNGLIMGHDYTKRTPGVIKALNEFCKKYDLQINLLTKDICPSYLVINKK